MVISGIKIFGLISYSLSKLLSFFWPDARVRGNGFKDSNI